jgi:CBS domain-containing membrane protein
MRRNEAECCTPLTISEEDILQAMRDIPGYLDISPGDFKEVFQVAYRHAVSRLVDSQTAADYRRAGHKHRAIAALFTEKRINRLPVVDALGRPGRHCHPHRSG